MLQPTSLESALAKRLADEGPIRVGMIGAGACARMVARHLLRGLDSVRVVGVANRNLEHAANMVAEAGHKPVSVTNQKELSGAFARGAVGITEEPEVLCSAPEVEVLLEITGTVEFAARVVRHALDHRKHVVLINAELDSTLGPILKAHAEEAGVIITHTDGEEPGVAMSLLRYVKLIGLKPVAAGNLKGMIDRYRTPETQRDFAAKHKMQPAKVTSFADGTKLSMECTILANATGFGVGKRGMYGPKCAHVRELTGLLPAEQLLNGGLIDYALGAEPYTGAFVLAHEEHPGKRADLQYFKLGEGPFYAFYTPYHLPQIQVVSSIAQAAVLKQATIAPLAGPVCEVVAVAKRDLKAGTSLDGVGGFDAYGMIENAEPAHREALLPIGLSEGCRLTRNVSKDEPISYRDVELPAGRLSDKLKAEQQSRFADADRPKI